MKICKNQIRLSREEFATVAKMMKKRRKELGISSRQNLADITGLKLGTINKLEREENQKGINKDTIDKITKALKCSLEYLVGIDEYPSKLGRHEEKRKEMITKLLSSQNNENVLKDLLLALGMAEAFDDRFVFEQSHIDSFANHVAFERYIYGRFSSNCLRVSQGNGKSVYIKKSDMDQIYSDLYHYLEMLISHYGAEAPDGVLSIDAPGGEIGTEELEQFQCMTAKQYWKQYNKSPEKYATITRQKAKDKD